MVVGRRRRPAFIAVCCLLRFGSHLRSGCLGEHLVQTALSTTNVSPRAHTLYVDPLHASCDPSRGGQQCFSAQARSCSQSAMRIVAARAEASRSHYRRVVLWCARPPQPALPPPPITPPSPFRRHSSVEHRTAQDRKSSADAAFVSPLELDTQQVPRCLVEELSLAI